MSPIALPCAAFSAAIFALNYLPGSYVLIASALLTAVLYILFRFKGTSMKTFGVCAAAYFAGLLCFGASWLVCVNTADRLDGSTMELRVLAETAASQLSDSVRFDGELRMEGYPSLGVIVYDRSGSFDDIQAGQYAVFTGKLRTASVRYGEKYDNYHTKGQFIIINVDIPGSIEGEGKYSILQRLKDWLTGRIDSVFSGGHAVFMRALMTGSKDAFCDDLSLHADMSRAGLMHIVAVSGMHISILMSLLCVFFGRSRAGSIITMLIIWGFVLMTGASPSAVRAGIMNSLLLLAAVFGRETDVLSSLCIALAVILLANPFAAAGVSLQLSFAAVLGIVFVNRKFRQMSIYRHSKHSEITNYIVDTAVSSTGVILFTAPLTAIHFGSVNLLSPISNVLSLWAVTYCFCFAYIACILPGFAAIISKLLAFVAALLCDYICLISRLISQIPFAAVYTSAQYFVPWMVITYAVIVAVLCFVKKKQKKAFMYTALLSYAFLALSMLITGVYYRSGSTFAVMDVGQGQCVAVMSGDDTVVVDCGNILSLEDAGDISGQYLLSRGRKKIDVLILTHLHTDHADGVTKLMEYLDVSRLMIPANISDEYTLLAEILASAEKNNVAVSFISEDSNFSSGRIDICLYAPKAEGSDNEKCMFVRLTVGDYDCIISGDSPMSRERELTRNYDIGQTEMLVVGHHGSRYSSSQEYLQALGGETAVISCGYNTFGHPTQEVLERLRDCGYNILRTDLDSDIEIRVR